MVTGLIPKFNRFLYGDKNAEQQGKRDKLKTRSKKTLIWVFVIALVAIGLFGGFQENADMQLKATAFGLIILIATCTGGAFVGFLFGLPRINKDRKSDVADDNQNNVIPNKPLSNSEKYLANSNLEEISDWLTKIIVGVGLTQIGKIPEFILQIAEKLNADFKVTGGVTFAVSFICFGTIFGFFVGYLVTKLYLEDVFEKRGGGI
ncbi:hypothetical protein KJK34_04825 [Flavobacterium sp. D11R37]|uniref:hypothetical protein n=1 Tax=Flavobacterium coralii TaxID=2838017 RepID=UPI001CA62295|nr:hypothetical protein [Flavobacterium coralii]MBY8962071.1 hypothetical protein [Flavobacterium coralii]